MFNYLKWITIIHLCKRMFLFLGGHSKGLKDKVV